MVLYSICLFCDWLISLSVTLWLMTGFLSLLKMKNIPYIRVDHILFFRSSVSGCLGCFHLLVVLNNAAVNLCIHTSL